VPTTAQLLGLVQDGVLRPIATNKISVFEHLLHTEVKVLWDTGERRSQLPFYSLWRSPTSNTLKTHGNGREDAKRR